MRNEIKCFNKTLGSHLPIFVIEKHDDWDQYIPVIKMVCRSALHEITDRIPDSIIFGKVGATK